MIKYFIVKTKCGHVGRDNYIPIDYPIYAESAKEAAIIARKRPGVKYDHANAILSVREVNKEEYNLAMRSSGKDPYWQKSQMGTRCNIALLFSRLEPEIPYHRVHKLAVSQRMISKSNKLASRMFRYHKACYYEKSLRRDIEEEYGIVV